MPSEIEQLYPKLISLLPDTVFVLDRDGTVLFANKAVESLLGYSAEQHLRYMAHYDSLTGLVNRAMFYEHFQKALQFAKRHDGKVALLYLDLNDFKVVNDTFGHVIGDKLLCEVAHRLQLSVRESDIVARMGGDEFTILLTQLESETAIDILIERIKLNMSIGFELGEQSLFASYSIGCAIYPDHGTETTHLLNLADAAMYKMKRVRR